MLPSFRLIAATFLCGFFVVFAGLRMAASLNDLHEGLPVMAAHAAPISVSPAADREARRGVSSVPVMYDLRFAVSPVQPTLVRTAPTVMERSMPSFPLAILPPEIATKDAADTAERAPEQSVAAINPETVTTAPEPAAPSAASSTIVSEPLPPPGPAVETPAEEPKAAAIEPQATPALDDAAPSVPAATDAPSAEPENTASVDTSPQDTAVVAAPTPAAPTADPEAAKPAPKSTAKPKPARKPRIRTAHRATGGVSFDTNNPASQPVGGQR